MSTYLVARVFTTTDALPRRAAVTRHGAVSPQPEQKPEPAANDFHLPWPQASGLIQRQGSARYADMSVSAISINFEKSFWAPMEKIHI